MISRYRELCSSSSLILQHWLKMYFISCPILPCTFISHDPCLFWHMHSPVHICIDRPLCLIRSLHSSSLILSLSLFWFTFYNLRAARSIRASAPELHHIFNQPPPLVDRCGIHVRSAVMDAERKSSENVSPSGPSFSRHTSRLRFSEPPWNLFSLFQPTQGGLKT